MEKSVDINHVASIIPSRLGYGSGKTIAIQCQWYGVRAVEKLSLRLLKLIDLSFSFRVYFCNSNFVFDYLCLSLQPLSFPVFPCLCLFSSARILLCVEGASLVLFIANWP